MISVPASKVYHTKTVNEAGMTAEGFTATNNMNLFYANKDTPTQLSYQLIHHKTRS
jgi:hypothetical protein